jgi:hypothetical protein
MVPVKILSKVFRLRQQKLQSPALKIKASDEANEQVHKLDHNSVNMQLKP